MRAYRDLVELVPSDFVEVVVEVTKNTHEALPPGYIKQQVQLGTADPLLQLLEPGVYRSRARLRFRGVRHLLVQLLHHLVQDVCCLILCRLTHYLIIRTGLRFRKLRDNRPPLPPQRADCVLILSTAIKIKMHWFLQ